MKTRSSSKPNTRSNQRVVYTWLIPKTRKRNASSIKPRPVPTKKKKHANESGSEYEPGNSDTELETSDDDKDANEESVYDTSSESSGDTFIAREFREVEGDDETKRGVRLTLTEEDDDAEEEERTKKWQECEVVTEDEEESELEEEEWRTISRSYYRPKGREFTSESITMQTPKANPGLTGGRKVLYCSLCDEYRVVDDFSLEQKQVEQNDKRTCLRHTSSSCFGHTYNM
jgi:hypothetical protein